MNYYLLTGILAGVLAIVAGFVCLRLREKFVLECMMYISFVLVFSAIIAIGAATKSVEKTIFGSIISLAFPLFFSVCWAMIGRNEMVEKLDLQRHNMEKEAGELERKVERLNNAVVEVEKKRLQTVHDIQQKKATLKKIIGDLENQYWEQIVSDKSKKRSTIEALRKMAQDIDQL